MKLNNRRTNFGKPWTGTVAGARSRIFNTFPLLPGRIQHPEGGSDVESSAGVEEAISLEKDSLPGSLKQVLQWLIKTRDSCSPAQRQTQPLLRAGPI